MPVSQRAETSSLCSLSTGSKALSPWPPWGTPTPTAGAELAHHATASTASGACPPQVLNMAIGE